MRSYIAFTAAFAAVASAQGQSSSIDAFPQTSFLQQTNSLGVVTGQPAVATSQPQQPAAVTSQPGQPAVVTSQPVPADIPAVGPGVHTLVLPGTGSLFNTTRTVVVSANNSTTIAIQTSSPSAGASGSNGASGSGASRITGSGSATGTGAPSSSQGAASDLKVAGSFLGLGAFVAAFL